MLTQTVVTAAPNPAVYGTTVTLTATVLASYFGPLTTFPAGSVQFADTTHGTLTVLLGSPVPLVNGQAVLKLPSATPLIPPLPVGIDDITATYIPATALSSVAFAGNTSQPFAEVILPVSGTTPTTTAVTPPSQTIAAGNEAGFTIAVTTAVVGAVPGTDPVYLFDLGGPTSNSGTGLLLGTASYDAANADWTFTTTPPLSTGTHSIEAVFAGDGTYTWSEGFATVTVVGPTPLPPPPIGPVLGDPLSPTAVAPVVQTGVG